MPSDIKNRCHETLTITFFNNPDATLSQQEDMAVEYLDNRHVSQKEAKWQAEQYAPTHPPPNPSSSNSNFPSPTQKSLFSTLILTNPSLSDFFFLPMKCFTYLSANEFIQFWVAPPRLPDQPYRPVSIWIIEDG